MHRPASPQSSLSPQPEEGAAEPSSTIFLSSALVFATSGKSFIHSYGLQASITARELIKAFERWTTPFEKEGPGEICVDSKVPYVQSDKARLERLELLERYELRQLRLPRVSEKPGLLMKTWLQSLFLLSSSSKRIRGCVPFKCSRGAPAVFIALTASSPA